MLADLALSQVAHKRVEYLNISEARRLAIGIQLVRDPGKDYISKIYENYTFQLNLIYILSHAFVG